MFLAMSTAIAPKISKIVLANGLHIFVLPQEFTSTFAAYYHFDVGSAHDPAGRSGIAHLLEHMMFKGTKRIGTTRANEYSELVTRAGGHGMNATTSYDMTRYYVQLPSHQLEMWFSLEAQRLREPVFRDFESEREVVLEERRLRVENQAEGVAFERHRKLLYPKHPYGVPVIGWPEDIRALMRSDAEEYFHTWYSPSNCSMVLVGDLDPQHVEALAEKYFGAWETQDLPERLPRPVKGIDSLRRDRVEFDALGHLRMAWITVPERHPDHDKLSLLSAVLGELSSSRLTRRLVHESELAAAVISFAYGQHESGSFNIIARPTSKSSLRELESGILEVVHELSENGVEQEELDRARIFLEANRTQRLYSKLSLAMDIGAEVALSQDPTRLDTYEERLATITCRQVNELTQRWLVPEQRCVVELERAAGTGGGNGQGLAAGAGESGEHRREAEPSRRGAAHSEGFVEMLSLIDSAPKVQFHVPAVGKDVRREEIGAGATLFLKEDHDLPGIRFNLHFKGGSNSAPLEILSAYALAGALWQEGGTGELDPNSLERAKESLGVTMSMQPGPTGWQLSLWTLSRNLDPALKLLRAMLREPRLDSTRLGILANKQIELMRRRADYPAWAIGFLGQKVLYGDHPRLGYQPTRAEIENLSSSDIARVLSRHLGPENCYLNAVGDFHSDALIRELEEHFRGWPAASDPERVWLEREPSLNPGVHILAKELAQPAVRFLGEVGVDRRIADEEHAALEILNRILGGSGFRSRLMERLRSDEGLTYGVSSSMAHDHRPGVPGLWAISFQTRKDAVARAVTIVEEECRRLREVLPAPDEVHEQIQAWHNSFLFRFENSAQAVTRLMNHELDDRPYERDLEVLAQIERVSREQVREAARRWLHPENFSITIFGTPSKEERKALQASHPLRDWERGEVLGGGYD